MDKIAIIGTGLIGASLGLAIKRALPKTTLVVGSDMERSHSAKAEKMGAVDRVEGSVRRAVEDAQVVIIATPVMAIRGVMELMAPHLTPGCLVTDTGSTKGQVMKWAEETLPREVDFVGGHPMAGRETSGPDQADGSLFRDKTYCLFPGTRARSDSVNTMVGLVDAIGARHFFMDAQEHDSFVGAVSHLPVLLSVALVRSTSRSPSWGDIAKVASTGYRDTTRLASGDPTMHRDICVTNGEPIVSWIDAFIRELYEIRQHVMTAADGEVAAIEHVFSDAQYQREQWLAGKVSSAYRPEGSEIPTFSENMAHMFLGSKLMEAQKRLTGGFRGKGQEEKK